jgi:hypothetical protein
MMKFWNHIKYAIFIIPAVVMALSYFSGINVIWSGILFCVFFAMIQVIHLPEDMLGGADNPEGEELHPKWIFIAAFTLLIFFLFIGWLAPSLWEYRAFSR